MSEKNIDNLVICSTLNQITNYLIIEKYKPKRIFNITYDKDAQNKMNINMKNDSWDKYLKEELSEKYKVEDDIELKHTDMHNIEAIKRRLENHILNKVGTEKVYWHVTGGQRTMALAINELVKDEELNRDKDKMIYIEGNTEKLIVNDYKGKIFNDKEGYGCENLTFKQVLNLTGFDTGNLEKLNENQLGKNDKEYKFYKKIYEILFSERDTKIKIDNENEDTLRNLLLKSNRIESSKKNPKRQEFIKKLFQKVLEKYKDLGEIGYFQNKIDEKKDNEFNKSYPAGYIFEKLTAYKIYDLIKNNPKIVGMKTSLKTYFTDEEKPDHMIDELDIVLLTNTGKIINFECKSGGMKGDNAKSHNYTTYRLSGVFGMPILLSPLYENEMKPGLEDGNGVLEKQLQALRAAKASELKVIALDGIKNGLEDLGIIE